MGLMGSPSSSPYYPPRARWRLPFAAIGNRIRRWLGRWRLRWPTARQAVNFCLQLLVPGLTFYFTGLTRIWRLTIISSIVGIVVLIIWLGYIASDLAWLIIISAHGVSVSHLLTTTMKLKRGLNKLIVTFATFFVLIALVYEPARRAFYSHIALPLRTPHGVVVVNPRAKFAQIERGELVAYRIGSVARSGFIVQGGYGLGLVLAKPADKVRFDSDTLMVNNVVRGRLATMPAAGEVTVPEKSWLIWPEIGIQIYGQVHPEQLAQQLLEIAFVDQERVVGKPYSWWFGRKQILHEQIWPPRIR